MQTGALRSALRRNSRLAGARLAADTRPGLSAHYRVRACRRIGTDSGDRRRSRCSPTNTRWTPTSPRARCAQAAPILIHARGLVRPARLQQRAIARHLAIQVDLLEMTDDTSFEQARVTFASLPPDCHLHHTGGTGAMAEGCWQRSPPSGGPPSLDPAWTRSADCCVRDDGIDIPLEELVDPHAVTFRGADRALRPGGDRHRR
jgi:hypothetical protein